MQKIRLELATLILCTMLFSKLCFQLNKETNRIKKVKGLLPVSPIPTRTLKAFQLFCLFVF